ncbi:ribosome biogenesis protein NSA2 isoform X1 [Vespula maculifrons]|uniref:Ribosome biogenesis protein NSA2 isoform X1 n=1 Tax=Vespula maculifrons TaxID=7453 RepID=A0ABD2CC86_VESMC
MQLRYRRMNISSNTKKEARISCDIKTKILNKKHHNEKIKMKKKIKIRKEKRMELWKQTTLFHINSHLWRVVLKAEDPGLSHDPDYPMTQHFTDPDIPISNIKAQSQFEIFKVMESG